MKTIQELIEACGGNIDEAEQPIEIALKVVPRSIDIATGIITFFVLAEDKLDLGDGGSIRRDLFDTELELPIWAIELVHS